MDAPRTRNVQHVRLSYPRNTYVCSPLDLREEQRKLGLEEFMRKLSTQAQDYYRTTVRPCTNAFTWDSQN